MQPDNTLLDRAIEKAKAAPTDKRVTEVLTDEEREAILDMVAKTTLPARDGIHAEN